MTSTGQDEAMTTTRTTCPYCGVGCGVLATRGTDGAVSVAGDPEHPANIGRLCSKGSSLAETLSLDDRLLHPEIDGRRARWDDALALVASRFSETVREHGPDSVAFYVSGQILTEDYYVANKLMKGFIGSANIDTNSRLCMASAVAGHRRAFGSDTVPATYADLEEADLVVFVGSNFSWCHPVLFQRLLAARAQKGTRLIVIDPRRTTTAEVADLHLAIEPDSDVHLFAGLLRFLSRAGDIDDTYVDAHVTGVTEALAAVESATLDKVADATGCAALDIARFYEEFSRTQKVVTVFSMGVNQSIQGSDKVNAILNCHLFTGRIGKPGSSPFSITGQPNAMGGREVGGLANMLASHMNLEDEAHRDTVRRFWNAPALPEKAGLKAVDLFRAVRDGKVKALWIMATNPADSLPEADLVQEALALCPFVVVSDTTRHTDTTRFAHVLLPGAAWGEKNGTVTNSERRISRQKSFLLMPGEARPDWWALAEVAKRMGFAGFDYAGPAAIFREHAALSAFENHGSRDFDIGAYAGLSDQRYETLPPFQWPQPAGGPIQETRFFADGGFYTPDRKARMVALEPKALQPRALERPLWLNTGRIRDQWHTMTRTAKTPRLMKHYGEPFAEIHPRDARKAGIANETVVELETEHGTALVRALVTDRQQRGSIFVPMHWTDQYAASARINALVASATDPVSGQPGFKKTAIRARAFDAAWYGFAISALKPAGIAAEYWAVAPTEGGWRCELAGKDPAENWQAYAAGLFAVEIGAVDWIFFNDARQGLERLAAFEGDRLIGALFVSPGPVALSRNFAASALADTHPGLARARFLAGLAGADRPDPGAIVCACRDVGVNQIAAAIRDGKTSVEAVGECTGAGTNCGSCRPEIARIIHRTTAEASERQVA